MQQDRNQRSRNQRRNYSSEGRPIMGIEVRPKYEGEDIERMIKRFRKKVAKSGILKEVVSRMQYEKPSDKRRREKKQNIIHCKKREEKQAQREKDLLSLESAGKRVSDER